MLSSIPPFGVVIADLLTRTPAHPFRIQLANGKSLDVRHPDFCFIAHNDSVAIVFDSEQRPQFVNTLVVVSVERL